MLGGSTRAREVNRICRLLAVEAESCMLGHVVPLAAGEPDWASDPLLGEHAGERILVLLRMLLEQALQRKHVQGEKCENELQIFHKGLHYFCAFHAIWKRNSGPGKNCGNVYHRDVRGRSL